MNIVRFLRLEVSLTQQAFAHMVGSSQPTVAAYESGLKSPTLRTLERMAAGVNRELGWSVHPKMTREDRRSLAYHRAIGKLLVENPAPLLDRAKTNIHAWTDGRQDAKALFARWEQWLSLPLHDLLELMLGTSLDCRDMRQVSPFAGILTAEQRTAILNEFRKDEAA